MNEQTADRLRVSFRAMNRWLMIPMWRLGLRRFINSWPSVGGRTLVLINTGRKSGLRRRTPLNFAPSHSSVFVLAGFGDRTDWYRNVLANPAVEVWLPDDRWLAEAIDVSDHPLRLSILRDILIASGFAAPLAGVDPRRLSDEELRDKTDEYKLVELQRRADATGTGGPGDLSWIWGAVGALWLIDRFRKK